jgi:hypothetical protein
MHIKFVLLMVSLLLISALEVAAQENAYPRLEVFGGVSYLPADGSDYPRKNSVGFQISTTGNVTSWFGILGDFGGQYSHVSDLGPAQPGLSTNTSVYEYLVGPRFTKRTQRVNLFVNALVGVASGRSGIGFSDSELAFGGGGGFDINISRRFAVRPLQVDYIGSFADMVEHNMRFSAGIVVRLGQ